MKRLKFKQLIGKYLSELVIQNFYRDNYTFPRLKLEFASLDSITNKYKREISLVILYVLGNERNALR